jgi:hypothetical protein
MDLKSFNLFDEIVSKGHDEDWNPPLPPAPTKARPGTKAKIEVMAARVERGEAIFHPDDPRNYEDGETGAIPVVGSNWKKYGANSELVACSSKCRNGNPFFGLL